MADYEIRPYRPGDEHAIVYDGTDLVDKVTSVFLSGATHD